MSSFETGPRGLPPEIVALIAEHGSIRNIPIEREYNTAAGPQVVKLTLEQWMTAFCPEDSSGVSDEEFERAALNFFYGRGHGQETT
jgi:hypothetical protein